MSRHTCLAVGCSLTIPTAKAFCPAHWKMLPKAMQTKLYDAYGAWQTGHEGTLQNLRNVQEECRVAIVASAQVLRRPAGRRGK